MGSGCHGRRIGDGEANWRVMYHLADDAIVVLGLARAPRTWEAFLPRRPGFTQPDARHQPRRFTAWAACRYASIPDCPLWIPYDLPEMLIGILKVTRVPAPEGFLSRLYDDGASIFRLFHNRINFCLGRNVMPERECCGARAA